MLDILISFGIVFYLIGVLGCSIAVFSLIYRFVPKNLNKFGWFILGSIIPFGNYQIMWHAFKQHYEYVTEEEDLCNRLRSRFARVNHGKGIKCQSR